MAANPSKVGLSDNAVAAIAYFTPVLPFFFLSIRRYNKRPYVRFHAWQSLLFNIFAITLGYVLAKALSFIGFHRIGVLVVLICVAMLAVFLLWLWCVISAMNGRRLKLPIIGNWADEQAYR
jgi:uncharacterized membrane protein